MNSIPKNLYMIWLGDNIPNYANFSANAYKEANPDFNVIVVHRSLAQIYDIYNNNITDIYDQLLYDAIFDILNKNMKYELLLNKTYMYILQHQETFYGKDIRFIQLLSDIYRLKLVENLGGIYVDCDTFPLKPFDDLLLAIDFIVTRHYNNNALNNIGNDNYFLGKVKSSSNNDPMKLLQTIDKWLSNILYLIRKKDFYSLKLKYIEHKDLPLYIEHYFDGNWKNINGRIRTQKCFLDNLYEH